MVFSFIWVGVPYFLFAKSSKNKVFFVFIYLGFVLVRVHRNSWVGNPLKHVFCLKKKMIQF